MLNKILNVHKLAPFAHRSPQRKPLAQPQPQLQEEEETCSVLKIVHVGGVVENYYMATPAARIMEKYPAFRLARPEVFRRPWESVVRPEEILVPGEKIYVVPLHTVRKLRQRIRRPSRDAPANPFVPGSSTIDPSSHKRNGFPGKSVPQRSDTSEVSSCSSFSDRRKNINGARKHVRFAGIDVKHKAGLKKDKVEEKPRKGQNSQQSHGRKCMPKTGVAWQPSLTSITETQGLDG